MSDIKVNGIKRISDLATASTVDETAILLVENSSGTNKLPLSTLINYLVNETLDAISTQEG